MTNKEIVIESLQDLKESLNNVDLNRDGLCIAEDVLLRYGAFFHDLDGDWHSKWEDCRRCIHDGCELEYWYEDTDNGCIFYEEHREEDEK